MHRKKKRSIKSALQQSLLIRVSSIALSLLTLCTILLLLHLSLGRQTDSISPFLSASSHEIPPRRKLPISFDLRPGVQPVRTPYSGSKQHGRVILNIVAKKIQILKGRL